MESPRTIFDKVEDGDSTLFVGISYLKIVAQQINEVRLAQREALKNHDLIPLWFNELRTFYDLVENRTGINNSKKEVEMIDFIFNEAENKFDEVKTKVKECEKYDFWFTQIEEMLERNSLVMRISGIQEVRQKKYQNNKKILFELSKCYRSLMVDANLKHLIMPEGLKDMKALVKDEWIDRDFTKEF